MTQIPKTIHQIWSGVDEPLPDFFASLGETWKSNHPNWQYEFWDNQKMNDFVLNYFPEYNAIYHRFKYNIQRWDAIRYLLLYKVGGMYVDFDYECMEQFDELIKDKTCCFATEPDLHAQNLKVELLFNNALMASTPKHPFMKTIIESVFNEEEPKKEYRNKFHEIMNTTGPMRLVDLYNIYDKKDSIYLIPASLVSPFSQADVREFLKDNISKEFENNLEEKLKDALAVHYFTNTWVEL